jgi:hypothetical protein
MGDMAFRDDISRGSAEPGPSSAAQSAVNDDDDRVLLWWAPILYSVPRKLIYSLRPLYDTMVRISIETK